MRFSSDFRGRWRLERQLDVVANNVANVNTAGYKADRSLFEEYLTSGAHEDNFVGRDRRVSYVQDRATFRDFAQGSFEQTNNPLDVAIDGDGLSGGAGRRAASATPATAICRSTISASSSRLPAIPCSAPPARSCSSRPITTSTSRPTAPSRCWKASSRTNSIRGKLRLVSFADAQSLLKQGGNLFAAGASAPQPDLKSTVQQGFVEKSNVNAVAEMSRMIEVMRTYTHIANLLQQQSDLHKSAIEKLADVPA